MKIQKPKVHFTDNDLINATNPITVNVIGAGGTGSKVLTGLMEMNHNLNALGHAGLQVCLWDDDTVTEANIGRQRFAESEIGLKKSAALINRVNRWSGTRWKAKTQKFGRDQQNRLPEHARASIYISCVDSAKARFEIAEILAKLQKANFRGSESRYWIDFGNSRNTGQVVLSTVGAIAQPKSKKFRVIDKLPFITDEFGDLLKQADDQDDTPSCSVAEALQKQDLFINGALAQLGCSLLWSLFHEGMTEVRGFFLNLKTFRSQPIPIT